MLNKIDKIYAELSLRKAENYINPRLYPVKKVLDLLGNPQKAYPTIHIAGTNGKTSTVHMLSSIMTEHNLKTGSYISPHITSVLERININRNPIDENTFIEVYYDVIPYIKMIDKELCANNDLPCTFFEVMTILGFAIFAHSSIDVAIIETGVGGTWDATNIINADVSVITPIALDHLNILGKTVEKITKEKIGIIKDNSIVISSVQEGKVAQIIFDAVEDKNNLFFENIHFGIRNRSIHGKKQLITIKGLTDEYTEIQLPLIGNHQAQNASLALAASEAFLGGGFKKINQEIIKRGFSEAMSPGRMEVINSSPMIILDAAHNPAGAKILAKSISELKEYYECGKIICIISILEEKDFKGIFEELKDIFEEFIITKSSSNRALSPDYIKNHVADIINYEDIQVEIDPKSAILTAVKKINKLSDVIVICGSITLLSDINNIVKNNKELIISISR